MAEDVRWVSAPDGTRVAYTVAGPASDLRSRAPGPASTPRPTLLLTNGLTTTTFFWKYLAAHWQQRYQVIRWDLPGHGLSDKPVTPGCMEMAAQPAIMKLIMEAEGVERAVQMGFSVGCQIVLEMYRQLPESCSAVVLLLGAGGRVFDTLDLPIGKLGPQLLLELPAPAFRLWYRLMARAARLPQSAVLAKRLGLIGAAAHEQDVHALASHLGTLEPISIQQMARSAAQHSAHDVLPRMRVPLLIFGGGKDPFAPLESVARKLYRLAPQAQLVELPRGTHTAMLDDPQPIIAAIDKFLQASSLG